MADYTLSFTSTDPIRRRMAQSSRSVSPGFPAIITAVDEAKKTCELWVEGSLYTLKNVNYATSLQAKPDFIKVGSPVYVRHSNGNKFGMEIEGPARVIPTVKAGTTLLPPQTGLPDMIISGLELYASAHPAMTVAVSTGSARFGGTVYDFTTPKIGESLDAKVTGASPGVLKVGAGKYIGTTYCYFPVPNNASSVNYRFDQIELGSDLKLDYIQGLASPDPQLTVPQSGHKLIGTILVRPNATRILWSDINAPFLGFTAMSVIPQDATMPSSQSTQVYTVLVIDQDGNPLQGVWITPSFGDSQLQPPLTPSDYGTLEPSGGAPTDNTGKMLVTYDRTTAIKSPYIFFRSANANLTYSIVTLLDASGNPIAR